MKSLRKCRSTNPLKTIFNADVIFDFSTAARAVTIFKKLSNFFDLNRVTTASLLKRKLKKRLPKRIYSIQQSLIVLI